MKENRKRRDGRRRWRTIEDLERTAISRRAREEGFRGDVDRDECLARGEKPVGMRVSFQAVTLRYLSPQYAAREQTTVASNPSIAVDEKVPGKDNIPICELTGAIFEYWWRGRLCRLLYKVVHYGGKLR